MRFGICSVCRWKHPFHCNSMKPTGISTRLFRICQLKFSLKVSVKVAESIESPGNSWNYSVFNVGVDHQKQKRHTQKIEACRRIGREHREFGPPWRDLIGLDYFRLDWSYWCGVKYNLRQSVWAREGGMRKSESKAKSIEHGAWGKGIWIRNLEWGMRNQVKKAKKLKAESSKEGPRPLEANWQRAWRMGQKGIGNSARPGLRLVDPTPRRVRLNWFRLLSFKLIVLMWCKV
jgi:hypothetical protein